MKKNQTVFGLAAGIIASSIWGGLYVVSKVVLDVLPPFTLLASRLVLALVVLLPPLFFRGWQKLAKEDWLKLLGIGVLGYGISLGLQFVGTWKSTAGNGAVITTATPAFVFLFAGWLLGERITKRRWVALLISTIGVLIVVDIKSAQLNSELFLGNLALVGAALTWGLYSILVRKATRFIGTLQVSVVAFVGGLIVALPMSFWELGNATIEKITVTTILGVLYIGVVSTAIGAYLWNKSFELLEAGLASLTFFAQPIVGTILGVIYLNEKVSSNFLIGGILIIIGIGIASKRQHKL